MNSERVKKAIKEVCEDVAQMTSEQEQLKLEMETASRLFQDLPDDIKMAVCRSTGFSKIFLKK